MVATLVCHFPSCFLFFFFFFFVFVISLFICYILILIILLPHLLLFLTIISADVCSGGQAFLINPGATIFHLDSDTRISAFVNGADCGILLSYYLLLSLPPLLSSLLPPPSSLLPPPSSLLPASQLPAATLIPLLITHQ